MGSDGIPPHLSLPLFDGPALIYLTTTTTNVGRKTEEGHMCPACIASTAVMVAGAGSTGGILAVCIGKFRKLFRENRFGLFQNTKEK
jgi:hypothetical protein